MKKFNFLKKYITEEKGDDPKLKHSLYKLDTNSILAAELRLGRKFPEELRDFYLEIGYGFICQDNGLNRFMSPGCVTDFILGEGNYENCEDDRETFVDNESLPFFQLDKLNYLVLKLSKKNNNGECPVYYYDAKIADSLEEFLEKMDKEGEYFIQRDDIFTDEELVDIKGNFKKQFIGLASDDILSKSEIKHYLKRVLGEFLIKTINERADNGVNYKEYEIQNIYYTLWDKLDNWIDEFWKEYKK